MSFYTHIASATLSNMEVSRAARQHVRVVHFANTLQHSRGVDADDFEAVAMLSNLVLQCGDKNATMPTGKQNIVLATRRAHCHCNSRLLHLVGSENYTPRTTSKNIALKLQNKWFFHRACMLCSLGHTIIQMFSCTHIFFQLSPDGTTQQCQNSTDGQTWILHRV